MRIGIDARFWNESGVGRYVRNLVYNLQIIDKKNEYVLFIQPKEYQQIANWKMENDKWKIVQTDIHWHSLEEQLKFPQVLNKENLDLMHFPYFSIPVFYNRPFIVTIHDLILHQYATGQATTKNKFAYWAKLLGYKIIIDKAASKAQKIITVSNSTKNDIGKYLKVSSDKIDVTYEGTSLSQIKPEPISNMPGKFLLHVGNLYPHKNILIVLKALADLKQNENIEIPLVLAGKKDFFHQKVYQTSVDMGLSNQIIFTDYVTDSQLKYLYGKALALISPSFIEGFDLPVVEAMSEKCLCIASDIPAHREICRTAAIYFNPKSHEDLSKILEQAYKNKKDKYKTEIEKGFDIASRFSWEKMAKETLKIYERSV